MQSKASLFASRLAEGGWLAAIVIVPVLFNVYTERVFEEDKLPLLRSIALVMALAVLVIVIEEGRQRLRARDEPLWRLPLVLPALALTGSYLLSTAFSVAPRISLWGAYIRRQGTYTWLAYIVVFFALLILVRRRPQVGRIITVLLLASVPATLYAFLQNRGLDPLPWGGNVVQRVSSTAGNPIFISAYLIMVYPLTLMRVLEHFKELLVEGDENRPSTLASSLLAGGYLFLLIIQTLTILFSRSRGPWLGLLAGLFFFFILLAIRLSRRAIITLVLTTMVGMAGLILMNIPESPLFGLREAPYIGRLGRVFELERGTGAVRVAIWEGAEDLLAADPLRALVGYGPETMYLVYTPYYPPRLAQLEARNASPDRAHNETFDSLVMTGILGFATQTFLFLSLFYYGFRWLGLLRTPIHRRYYLGLLALGGVLGTVIPYLIEGRFRFAGVGLPLGLSLGLIAYLAGYALTHLDEVGREPVTPRSLLLTALVAGAIGHFIEAHFGIAIGATRLHFWIYAALIVVVGHGLVPESEPATEVATGQGRRRRRRSASVPSGPLLSGTLVTLSLVMGLLMMVLTFNFVTPRVDVGANGYALVWLFTGSWLFGALAVGAESSFEQGGDGRWLERLLAYAAISLGSWVLFLLLYVPWVQWQPSISGSVTPDQLAAIAGHVADNITWIYGATLLVMIAIGIVLSREERAPRALLRQPGWQGLLYLVLAIGLVPLIVRSNLDVSRADVLTKQATGYENGQQWDAARVLYERALALQPNEDRYFLNLGRTYLEQARRLRGDPETQLRLIEQGERLLERALESNPLNTDHYRNLASLHRVWSTFPISEGEQQRHRARADEYYTLALEHSPNNTALWNDWATLLAEEGRYDEALERLERSAALDDSWYNTHLLSGSVAIEAGDFERALDSYERAIELRPDAVAAHTGRAVALARMERTADAIDANLEALMIAPDDYTTLKNLALLYLETGELEASLATAQRALQVAQPQDRASMEAFIEQVGREIEGSDSGG